MPSTVVHVALGGLIGTALLADHFDGKAVLVVMAATAFVDLDTFVGLWIEGAHRAAFHTLVVPGLAGALLWWDLRGRSHPWVRNRSRAWPGGRPLVRDRSLVRSRWGARGVRVAWVSIVAVTLAGIGPDLFFNGANLLYPFHDQFFDFSGKVLYSNQRGFVQTLFDPNLDALVERVRDTASDLGGGPDKGGANAGGANAGGGSGANKQSKSASTTDNTHYSTGVDPSKGKETQSVERIFPIAMTGERALLALTGYGVVGLRVWEERRRE